MIDQTPNKSKILLIAGIILSSMTLLVGVAVFLVMEHNAEELQSKRLQMSLNNEIKLIKTEIESVVEKVEFISARPLLIQNMQVADMNGHSTAVTSALINTVQPFALHSNSAIKIYGKGGQEWASVGIASQQSELAVLLIGFPLHVELIWDRRLLLRVVVDIKKKGSVIGKIMIEHPLPNLMRHLKEANLPGNTHEFLLCIPAAAASAMQCLPTKLNPQVFTTPSKTPEDVPLPMYHALEGLTGYVIAKDYRNQLVTAAYAPVGDYGLGMVLKIDSAELNAPIRQTVRYVAPIIAALLIIALLLLHWLLSPLVLRLTTSAKDLKKLNSSLAFQNEEKDQRAKDLLIATAEKDQRSKELVIANEEKDKRVAELVIATAAKDQFLTSMSHELRTPLNAVIGLSQALVSDTTVTRSPQESEYVAAINSSGQHLLNLIGDILDLSKLNAGARSLEKEPFTIRQLMEECRNTFLVACQDKGVSLNVDSQLDGAYPVVGDITVLKQILYNVLSNAVKFTQSGSVTLTAEPYVAEEIDPNPNLGIMFTVADTGKGISADAIGTLFDPFTQEDNGITRSFGGSGLGLNIAQKQAQLMGGEISCNSIVGQGSIFEVIVYLEQQPGSFERLDVDHSERFEVPPLKLLIVDDVPLNLMVAAALLKPKGHIIETAANGHKALEMASNNDYDAILMDVHMPGMDGMEATRRIRSGANTQRAAVPILALTADVDVRQKALFMASGMDATVGKPWELKVLEKELKRLLKLG
jgi:signal transduction histidine kinase